MLLLACHIRGVWLALLYLVTVVTSAPAISDWRDRILSYPFLEAKLQWGPHQAIADYRKIEHAMTNPVVTYVKGYNEEAWEPVFEAFSSVFHVYSAAQVADDKRTVISLTAALRNTDINNAETFVNHVWKTLIPSEREAVPDSVPDHIFADWPALNWVSPQTDDQYVNLICFMTLSNLVDPSEPVVSVPEYWGTIRRVPSTITRLGSLITKGHLPGFFGATAIAFLRSIGAPSLYII
ncbi:hypothetical protein CXG81DRAFT_19365 [Caulochytrium protostelioides]|uniref:Uncharacterized protein n=1 Tax=Caulochytrium protostelioides TaxID=1555241 RepID=A0A4P9X6Q3_9FUNG|nr:hypothetical protein CXG81DRAFT_19365 [Caulochytrium protostelioides]|eukprot:RKP00710.1 hypothetical protein CXG81DRAFT_19365 [Caulochytrium protostelioides]